VVRPEIIETTALGAAYLAGIATGFYRGEDEVAQQWRASRTFHPVISRDEALSRMAQWEMAVAQVRLPTTRGH
jgi:glycerol kinase